MLSSLPGLLALSILLGVPAGVGAFTFVYAKGFSYMSSDPRACVNCHVMKPQCLFCRSMLSGASR